MIEKEKSWREEERKNQDTPVSLQASRCGTRFLVLSLCPDRSGSMAEERPEDLGLAVHVRPASPASPGSGKPSKLRLEELETLRAAGRGNFGFVEVVQDRNKRRRDGGKYFD